MSKTVSTISVKKAVTLLVILAAIIVAVVALWPLRHTSLTQIENAPTVDQLEVLLEPQGVVNTAENLERNKSLEIAYSTPKEHDQMVISSSLEGADIDGALQADGENQLILSIDVRDFFDYFLSTADEIGPEAAIGEIQRYANQYLPEPARTQAVQLLEKYLSFKQTEYQLQQMPISQDSLSDKGAITVMRESFEALKSNREMLFSPIDEHALFGLEDTYAEHTLSTLELMADESLSNEQINAGLQVLESQLPPELSNSFAQTRADNQRAELVSSLVDSELDDSQLHTSLVDQGLGADKANEIIERRQQQLSFDQNYQRYSQSLGALDSQQADFDDLKLGLLQRYFLSPEQQTQARLRDLRQD
jgi:lipase chaperone LimK